jgi:EAL and modified HD-GYP domain-containing signal transduction protein
MFIARQPIFNRALKIYGYELLFRANAQVNSFSNASSTSATAVVLGGLFEQGIEKVVGSAKAFVNFDYEFIMYDMIELINPDTLVIEVLETAKGDSFLLNRIDELRGKGYKIALDDFGENYLNCPAALKADIIKYDIIKTPLDTICKEVNDAILQGKVLLAEKIETEEEYQKARAMGFTLFQGYFFSRPNIVVKDSNTKKSSKVIYSRILSELKNENFSYDRITDIIESDVKLSYRMIYAMSHKNKGSKYDSIKKALVRMGAREIERWISILMLQNMLGDKPDEVLRMSLVRAKFCEYVAERSMLRRRKDEASMMGLFSMLDVILNCSMAEALEELAISEDVARVLVNGEGTFKPLFLLMKSYEGCNWDEVVKYADEMSIDSESLTYWYLSSIEWASEMMDVCA